MPGPSGYFDAQEGSTDLAMLPTWLRESEELAGLAIVVENDILAAFTTSDFNGPAYAWRQTAQGFVLDGGPLAGMVKIADNLYVALRGYAVDPSNAEAFFKAAFKKEIAAVLRWRLPQQRRDPGVTAASDGDKSLTFRDDVDEPFPPQFPLHLRPFVVSETVWTL